MAAAHAFAELTPRDLGSVGTQSRQVGFQHHAAEAALVPQRQRAAVLEGEREAVPTPLEPRPSTTMRPDMPR